MKFITIFVLFTFLCTFSFSQNDSIENEEIILYNEVIPSFPGGEEKRKSFIKLVQHYPDSAKSSGIEGKVYVQFLVGKKGKLFNIKVLRSPDTLLSQEAIRIVNLMPNWIPGTNYKSDSVEVNITMPIEFKINKELIFNNVDSMPEFPGGEVKLFEYLGKNFKLTQLENGQIFFSYYFEFIVEKDGSTSNLRVLKNHSDMLYKDVALFFNGMPMWSPGLHNGKPVRTKMVLPIRIHLR
ncbi:MAG: energy transducer TonB [Flavobacteriales bacterium]